MIYKYTFCWKKIILQFTFNSITHCAWKILIYRINNTNKRKISWVLIWCRHHSFILMYTWNLTSLRALVISHTIDQKLFLKLKEKKWGRKIRFKNNITKINWNMMYEFWQIKNRKNMIYGIYFDFNFKKKFKTAVRGFSSLI